VVTDLFLTDTARMADIILPAASMYEYYDLITGYGHSYIQLQQKIIDPPGECKHETEIYRLLGEKFNFNLDYLPENNLFTIEKIISSSNLNISINELKEKPYLHPDYQEIAFSNLKFNTPTSKIEFYSQQMKDRWDQNPLPFYEEPMENKYSSPNLYAKYPLTLISAHSLNKMNSQFSNRNISKEEPFIWINPEDAENRGINDGQKVKVYNERGSLILKAILTEKVSPGIVHTYFGWWDGVHQANLNKLTGEHLSDIGYGTAFHNCLVEIQKVK